MADKPDLHSKALTRFNTAYDSTWTLREEALGSRRFNDVLGAQWENWAGEQYANRPRFEINKIARSVDRIFNEYKANRITVDFKPVSETADDEMADLLDGLFRADENESNAQEAYDNAFQEGVKGGFGAWRIKADYEDPEEDDEQLKVCIDPIYDADISVFFDPASKRYDKSDAKWAMVLYPMPRADFDEEYPDSAAVSWNQPRDYSAFDWVTLDVVTVAEYYEREEYKVNVHTFTQAQSGDIQKVEDADLEESRADLEAMGYTLTNTRKIERYRVHKWLLSGVDVLEDCGYIAGKHIPIIPFYGNRSVISGVERFWGQVQKGRDSQQLYNMNVSSIAETASLSQRMKPIFHPEEIAGHEYTWATDNIDNNPFLLRNPLTGADGNIIYGAPMQFTQPSVIAPATAALLDISNRDIQDVTGNLDQQQDVTQQTSGVAIEMVQNRLDMGVFGYMDNMAQSMRRCGEIWLSIRKDIETKQRKVRTVSEDGSQGEAELMMPAISPDTGADYLKNDIASGKYKVVVDVAPSFATKRQSTVRNVMGLMGSTADPQMQTILMNVALQNMEGEGMQALRKWSRNQLVQMGVEQPNEEELQQMQEAQANQQPTPQDQYLIAEAQKSQASTEKLLAETQKTQAQTAEIMQAIDMSKIDQVLNILNQMNPQQGELNA